MIIQSGFKLVLILCGLIVSANSFCSSSQPSKFVGNISGYQPTPDSFTQYWQQITPENAGYWSAIEGQRNRMNWSALDRIYQFAIEHELVFTERAFISSGAYPGWFAGLDGDELTQEFDDFTRAFCERYPLTDYLIVINEPLRGQAIFRDALDRTERADKWDWVVHAYEIARRNCPNAKLTLNEYGIFDSPTARAAYKELIVKLKDNNLLDVIGIQSHWFSLERASTADISLTLDDLSSTGLPIYITELDIAGDDDSQRRDYETIFPLLYSHQAVIGITLWGYIQGQTWREHIYLLRTDGSERPALEFLKTYLTGDYNSSDQASSASSQSSSVFSSRISSSSISSSASTSSSFSSTSNQTTADAQCNWYGRLLPLCTQSENSNNWGWENNRSCVGLNLCPIVVSNQSSTSSSRTYCDWYGTSFPFCQTQEQGFGWENGHACVARETCI